MATKVVFYSVTGHSRSVAEGTAVMLGAPLYGLTDRFSSRFAGWRQASRRAVRSLDIGVLVTTGVSFDRGDRLVIVFPFWRGPIVPAVSGFIRSVSLEGVEVFLVVTRRLNGGDALIVQLEDDIVRQGGTVRRVFGIRTLWRDSKRLEFLGGRIGRSITREPELVPLSLQELLGGAIEDRVEARARYLQLAEMTPNRRLKESLELLAASEVSQAQTLQQTYRLYSGTVYEQCRESIAPLKPEQVFNYAAFLDRLSVAVELERRSITGYQAIARRFWSQPDIVNLGKLLMRLEQRHFRKVNRMNVVLNRHRPQS